MIEVRKLIPQVYNQSRDFSVFMGALQIMLNEIDHKSRILEGMPKENILLGKLRYSSNGSDSFRILLKNKGTINSILYALRISGGKLNSFDEEEEYLDEFGSDELESVYSNGYLERDIGGLNETNIDKTKLVYYTEKKDGVKRFYINVFNPEDVDTEVFNNLKYYLSSVKAQIFINPI